MANLDKLAALSDALNIEDDTDTLNRPDLLAPRSVRDALQQTQPTVGAPPPDVRQEQGGSSTIQRERSVTTRSTTTIEAAIRMRSTINLPVELSRRVNRAKQERWELSELLAQAIHNVPNDVVAADGLLSELREQLWVQRHYRITPADRDQLDQIAATWRMNRSESIAVLLVKELDRLRFR